MFQTPGRCRLAIPQVVKSRVRSQSIDLNIRLSGNLRVKMVLTRHVPTVGALLVLSVITMHGTALRSGGIAIMAVTVREGREVRIEVKVMAKGAQAGGVEDPGAVVIPV